VTDEFEYSHDSHNTNQTHDLAGFAHDLKILEEKDHIKLGHFVIDEFCYVFNQRASLTAKIGK